jgi:hypothetical protein
MVQMLEPVEIIGFFCNVIYLKRFNVSHLMLNIASKRDSSPASCKTTYSSASWSPQSESGQIFCHQQCEKVGCVHCATSST